VADATGFCLFCAIWGMGNWSKAGGFGEDTPNRKCYLELELEQSKRIRKIAPILEGKQKIDMEQ